MATAAIANKSVVFSNSNAAADLIDSTLNEDSDSLVLLFDVLAASGGGKNTTIHSVDDGTSGDDNPRVTVTKAFASFDSDLLYGDGASAAWQPGGDTSAQGAHVWTGTDGKIHYDASNLVSTLQSLDTGDTFTDTFEYAIKMSNGTLSVGTATVKIAGLTDPPPTPSEAIAFYNFDESSGTTAFDTADAHDGTIIGATRVEGIGGNALQFNGSSDYVSVPDSPEWDFGNGNFTVEFWANFGSDLGGTVGQPDAVFVGHDEGSGETNKWWVSGYEGHLGFHINSPAEGPVFFADTPFTPQLGQWYLIDLVRNGSTYEFYINGQHASSDTNSRVIPDIDFPLEIGQGEGFYFDGALDNVAIYDVARSGAEIAQTYQDWIV